MKQGNYRSTISKAIISFPRTISQLILKRLDYDASVYSNHARPK